MAAIKNDIDAILQATYPRLIEVDPANYIRVAASRPLFKVQNDLTADVSSIDVIVSPSPLINFNIETLTVSLDDPTAATFVQDPTNPRKYTLAYTDLVKDKVTFTAEVTLAGTTYSSSTTISKVFDGTTLTLTKDSVSFLSNDDGSISDYSPGAIGVKVFRGELEDTAKWTFSLTNSTGVTAAVTGNGSSAVFISISNLTNAITSGTVTVTAVSDGVTLTKVINITKLENGQKAITANFLAQTHIVSANTDGTGYSLPTENFLRLFEGAEQLTTGVTYSGGGTVSGLTASINASTGAITLSGASWVSDTASFTFTATYNTIAYNASYSITKAKAGTSSIRPDLLSETDSIPALNDGTGYTLPTGNVLRLFNGVTQQTTGVTYSGGGTVSGLTASINSTTGAITLSGASWTSDSASFTFTATYNSIGYTTSYSISKAKAGADAIRADLLSETDSIPALNDGTGYSLPTGNALRLYRGVTLLSSGVAYSGGGTVSGLTASINSTTGAITLSGASWVSDTASFTFTATFNSIAYTASYSITKAKAGNSGQPGVDANKTVTLYIYQWNSSQPSIAGLSNTTFTWSSLSYTAPSGWTTSPGSPTATGQQLYTVTKIITDVSTALTTSIQWSTGTLGVIGIREDGSVGPTGPRTASGFVYNSVASSAAPSTPTGSSFNYSNQTFGSLTANWSTSPSIPTTQTATTNQRYWSSRYVVTESTFGGTQTITFSTPTSWINFDGLVTFTNLANATNGSGTSTTTINGGAITTGSIAADRISTTSLSAISANLGLVSVSTTGYLRSRAYDSTTAGFFLGYDSTAYKFDIGSSTAGASQFKYDGTNVSMKGSGASINVGTSTDYTLINSAGIKTYIAGALATNIGVSTEGVNGAIQVTASGNIWEYGAIKSTGSAIVPFWAQTSQGSGSCFWSQATGSSGKGITASSTGANGTAAAFNGSSATNRSIWTTNGANTFNTGSFSSEFISTGDMAIYVSNGRIGCLRQIEGRINVAGSEFQNSGILTTSALASGGSSNAPAVGFHWVNVAALTLAMHSDGALHVRSQSFTGSNYRAINASAFTVSSDRKLKYNIKPISKGLQEILAIKPVSFNYISEGTPSIGFIAQDLVKVIDEVVTVPKDDKSFYAVDHSKLVPILVKAIQEQQTQINELRNLIRNTNEL